jgi:hypothetical protein
VISTESRNPVPIDEGASQIAALEARYARLEQMMEHLITAIQSQQGTNVANRTVQVDALLQQTNASTSYSQAHIVQPSHSVSWAKVAAHCPADLKDVFDNIRKEDMQQDRTHRRNRKNAYSGSFTRVFATNIPRFRPKMNADGVGIQTRLDRTQLFLQAARVQISRIHSMFPRGYKIFEFLVEESYATSFKAALIEMNCSANESYNPNAPRRPAEATKEKKSRVKESSLQHYTREAMRKTASPAAKAFYRKEGIALVGETQFNTACDGYEAYPRTASQPNVQTNVRRRSISPEDVYYLLLENVQ